ncbi:hypothetical protein ABZ550_37195 [Streptomyces hygroscopicus]
MIEGLLRHCTDTGIESNYVDSRTILCPQRSSAFVASGLPRGTSVGFPCSTHARYVRGGCPL